MEKQLKSSTAAFLRVKQNATFFQKVQGGPKKFLTDATKEFSAYSEAKQSCNMAIEQKFYGLSEYGQFKNIRPLIKYTDRSK